MIRAFTFAFVAILAVSVERQASAQEPYNVGLAYYGIANQSWPCDSTLEGFEGSARPALAMLWNTFGTDLSCAEKFLADPRPKLFELHLVNSPCQSNGRCGSYELLSGISVGEYDKLLKSKDQKTIDQLVAYAKDAADWLLPRLNGAQCFISVFLEDPYGNEAVRNAIAAVRPLFPGCRMVRNPRGVNPHKGLAGADVFEDHGPEASVPEGVPCIVDLDGVDISFPQRPAVLPQYIESSDLRPYIERYARCEANFLWTAEMNGLTNGPFVDPRQRSNWPSPLLVELLEPFMSPASGE